MTLSVRIIILPACGPAAGCFAAVAVVTLSINTT